MYSKLNFKNSSSSRNRRNNQNILNNHCKMIALNFQIFLLFIIINATTNVSAYSINSPPVFDFKREIYVSENASIGQMVSMVRTIDQENDIITYSIEPGKFRDGSKYFQINERTGQIFVKESLMGQGGNAFSMYIKAYDGHQYAKIEVMISVSKAQDKGNIVSYPDILPHQMFSNIIINRTNNIPIPKDIPIETFKSSSKSSIRFNQRIPINKLNQLNITSTTPATTTTTIADSIIPDHDEQQDFQSEKSNNLFKIIIPLAPYISIICFVPVVCFITWIIYYKCQRNVPTRNAIKTFSHKIINNNKSESIETTTSSFMADHQDFNLGLFRNRKLFQETSADCLVDNNTSGTGAVDNKWEFPRHHLRFLHILGQGCFGQVWKCEAFNIGVHQTPTTTNTTQIVAVKTLKENASEKEKRDLLEELQVMKVLDPHPNVVSLIGSCTERDPVYLIMEFVPFGKLQKYLQDSREDLNYGNFYHSHDKLNSHDLISFAYQIAKGMEYLSSKNVIHRDLAARNILVGHNKVCKIADFGLAKYNQEIYERKSEGRLPIRWMACESLQDFIFTTKSDVWSFGILMWEIVTLGCTPYPGMTATEVIKKVCEGYRLEKPEHCKREMYNIMYYCWDRNPHHRPSFTELLCLLDNLFCGDEEYIELDRFPDHSYYNILKPLGGNSSGEKL